MLFELCLGPGLDFCLQPRPVCVHRHDDGKIFRLDHPQGFGHAELEFVNAKYPLRGLREEGRRNHLLPLRVFPLWRFPALSWFPGHIPAHDAMCAPSVKGLRSARAPNWPTLCES
jgi:hypothetical protein